MQQQQQKIPEEARIVAAALWRVDINGRVFWRSVNRESLWAQPEQVTAW